MAAHFYEYLEFNSEEDRENQLDVYVGVQLSAETEAAIKAISSPSHYLVMAEPFCPDCVEVVAYFQRMAKLNLIFMSVMSRVKRRKNANITIAKRSNKLSGQRKKSQVFSV